MRNAIRFSIASLILALQPGTSSADSDGPEFFEVRDVAKNDVLNVRAEPNPRAAKVGEIPHDGTCIRNIECQGGLNMLEIMDLSSAEQKKRERENPLGCKVEYRAVTGWVAGRYLAEGDEGDCRLSGASFPAR